MSQSDSSPNNPSTNQTPTDLSPANQVSDNQVDATPPYPVSVSLVDELVRLLGGGVPPAVRGPALREVLGLTGSDEGLRVVVASNGVVDALVDLMGDPDPELSHTVHETLVNLSADPCAAQRLLDNQRFLPSLLPRCTAPPVLGALVATPAPLRGDQGSPGLELDLACAVLANVSRTEACAERIVQFVDCCHDDGVAGRGEGVAGGIGGVVERVVSCLTLDVQSRHHLASFLSNITQVRRVRHVVLDAQHCLLERLTPFVSFVPSLTRRAGVVGAIRNCCFETDSHDWLLAEEGVDLLPRLLLPLAGGEELDEEDTRGLPLDLQLLPPDKQREGDAGVRRMLVETINQLCATQRCRARVKALGTYVILREYHRWETDELVLAALENLIAVLICDEPAPGMEDLNTVLIPHDIQAKLDRAGAS